MQSSARVREAEKEEEERQRRSGGADIDARSRASVRAARDTAPAQGAHRVLQRALSLSLALGLPIPAGRVSRALAAAACKRSLFRLRLARQLWLLLIPKGGASDSAQGWLAGARRGEEQAVR